MKNMIKFITTRRLLIIVGLFILLFMLLIYANLQIVKASPGGYDFFPHWYATRIYIKDGINPYSETSIGRIEDAMKLVLIPGEAEVYRFAAPLFAVVLYTPVSLIGDFEIARAVWMALLEIMLFVTCLMLVRWVNWKRSPWVILLLCLLTLLALPSIQALIDGSIVIPAIFIFGLAATLIQNKHDEAAGLLLAFSLVHPILLSIGVIMVLIWAGFRHRTKIIWWFLGTFLLLIGFTVLLVPDWTFSYIKILLDYTDFNPMIPASVIENQMVDRLNLAKTVLIIILLFYEWVIVKAQGKRRMTWNFALLFLLLPWMANRIPVENTVLYMPSIILTTCLIAERWKERAWTVSLLFPVALFILAWVFSGILIPDVSIVLSKIIIFVVQPLLILLFIYWARWWVLSQEKFSVNRY